MADPHHIFSNEDALVLDADVAKNERKIGAFRPKNDKLYLGLPEAFKEKQLLALSESLLMLSAKQRMKHLWYDSHFSALTISFIVRRLHVDCELSDAGFEAIEKLTMNNLKDSTAVYLRYLIYY